MRNLKFQQRHCVLLFMALVMVLTLVTGCAAKEEEKPAIILADNMNEEFWVNNAIAKLIIEEGYGYPVETVEVTTPVMQASLANGDLDVILDLWKPNYIEWYTKEAAAGNIESLGVLYKGGAQFFTIPKWVADEYNIKTVFDMKDHWELFKDPEDPTKGIFINCIIGYQACEINTVKLEAYGLTDYYNISVSGSTGAEDAALTGAQKKHEPVFGYYYTPSSIMGMYDWYILEEPEYNEAVWSKITAAKNDKSLRPLSEACAYETIDIEKAINPGLRKKAPDIVEMLSKMAIGLEPLNKTAAWAVENEIQDWEEAGVYYLKTYEDLWKTWVTDDAYKKIKDALKDR